MVAPDGTMHAVGCLYPLPRAEELCGSVSECCGRVEDYASSAAVLASRGKELLLLDRFPGLAEARLAVLGARQQGLPLLVRLSGHAEEGEDDSDLACLLCLQSLGAAGFGPAGGEEGWPEKLLPYSNIPLLANAPPAAQDFRALLDAGIRIVEADIPPRRWDAQAEGRYGSVPRPPRPEDSPLLLCRENGVYYLEEDFTVSEPIFCELDMSAAILDMEDTGADALLFEVKDLEDAEYFGRNVHMAKNPVCLLAGGEEALEAALLFYPGRALVDSRSDVPEDRMRFLAGGYGAVIR